MSTPNPSPKKIAASLARISDPDDPREASLDSQEEAILARLDSKGYYVPPEYRFREQYTGMDSIYDRPVLNHIRNLVRDRKIEGWGIYHTDRLAREPKELCAVWADNKAHGVETVFVKLDGVFEGRVGEAMLFLFGTASAVEWDQIQDRTMRGRREVLNKGRWVGGGPVRYGLIYDRDTRSRTPCPETAPVVRDIFRRIAGGTSSVALVRELNDAGVASPASRRGAVYKDGRPKVWVQSTVISMIRDRTYIGDVAALKSAATDRRHPNGKKVRVRRSPEDWLWLADARTEPIVARELFDAANAALAGRKAQPSSGRRVLRESLLRGMIWCGDCGSRMTPAFRQRGERGATYRCTGDDHARGVRRTGCSQHLGAGWIEGAATEAVEGKLFDPGFVRKALLSLTEPEGNAAIERDLKRWKRRKREAEKQLAALLETDLTGFTKVVRGMFNDNLKKIDAEVRRAEEEIDGLSRRLVPVENRGRIIAAVEATIAGYRRRWTAGEMTVAQRRDMLLALETRVKASKDRKIHVSVSVKSIMAARCAEDESSTSGTFDFCARITLPVAS